MGGFLKRVTANDSDITLESFPLKADL